jgi:hypothetical protein
MRAKFPTLPSTGNPSKKGSCKETCPKWFHKHGLGITEGELNILMTRNCSLMWFLHAAYLTNTKGLKKRLEENTQAVQFVQSNANQYNEVCVEQNMVNTEVSKYTESEQQQWEKIRTTTETQPYSHDIINFPQQSTITEYTHTHTIEQKTCNKCTP